MTDIPDDILEAAKAFLVEAVKDVRTGTAIKMSMFGPDKQAFEQAISRAILAERQRCVLICDAEREWGDFHPDDVTDRIQKGKSPRQVEGWNCPYESD